MEIKGLDFSQYHDLGHWPFTRYCRGQYGGWRNHLSLLWEYRCKPTLAIRISCRVGRHKWTTWSKTGSDETWQACLHCSKPRSPRT